jgi:hypothetical protein
MSAVPHLAFEPRLRVAMASHGDRTRTFLRAYIEGPGRSTFVSAPLSDAQCLIADYDHAASRHELQRFRALQQRPVIVLALRDPSLPGTVWVPKPIDVDALASAAVRVRRLLAPAVEPSAPSRPTAARDSRQQALRLIPVPHPPNEPREPAGPFQVAARPDWTSKIVWTALGVLGIVGLTTALGWEPAGTGWRPPPPAAAVMGEGADETLRRAVEASLNEAFRTPLQTQRQLDALLVEYRQAAARPAEARAWNLLSASADALTVSPYALPVALMSTGDSDALRQQREAQLGDAVARALAGPPRR